MIYDEQRPAKPAPSREVLERHLASVNERLSQIDLLLQAGTHSDFQTQELQSERSVHLGTKADIERTLNPPKVDEDFAKAHAESRKLQAEQMARDHAPPPPEVLEERRQNAAKRREQVLDAEEKLQAKVLMSSLKSAGRAASFPIS